MTDSDFLDHLRAAERFIDQYPGPRGMREACEHLDRRLRGRCQDRHQRDALHRICCSLHDGSARILDKTIEDLTGYLRTKGERDTEKMIQFARNYGADNPTLRKLRENAMQDILNVSFPPGMTLDSALGMPLTATKTTMNKTSIELQAELDAAIAREAQAAADAAKAEELAYYFRLHAATGAVLTDIRDKATTPRALTAEFRKELKDFVAGFGFKIVLVGDRSTAVLVQL